MAASRSTQLAVPRLITSLIHQTLEAARQLSDHGRLIVDVECLASSRGMLSRGQGEEHLEVQVKGENEAAVRWYMEGLLQPLALAPERYREIGRDYVRSIYGKADYRHLLRSVSLANVL